MRLLGLDVQITGLPSPLARRGDFASSSLKNPSSELMLLLTGMAQSATGITVTPLKALGVATVFGCVRVLADTISTLPLEVRQRQGRDNRLANEHRLYRRLGKKPNKDMTSVDWRAAVQANLSLNANGFSEILRDSDGDTIGVYPIESSRVDYYRDGKELVYRVTDSNVVLKSSDILHLRSNTFNGIAGVSTTSTARECIALALAMQDNAAKFFGNGSRPGGVLEHPESLSPEAQKRLIETFETQATGANLYRMMVLEEGLKYQKIRSENKDSQFLESRDAQNLEICRIFGVPPHKVGIMSGQPRANVEEENISFVMDVVRPICVKWETEMDTKLFTEEEQDQGFCTYFDLDALMRGNMEARFKAYAIGRQWGVYSANDCLAREGQPPYVGGDVRLQPINMIDATKATDYLMSKQKQQPSEAQAGNGGANQDQSA